MNEGWKSSMGSAPKDIDLSAYYEFRRNGLIIGIYKGENFNWELWCEYRPVSADASRRVMK